MGTQIKPHWFRSTYTQAVILGLTSFCSPGIWYAMANLGAGGLQSAQTGNAATSATFCLMFVTAMFGPALLGKVGVRWTLFIGTIGAAGLYTNSKYGNQWFVVLGAAICGVTAGIFWAVQGATIVSYAEPSRRGKAIAIWFSLEQFGPVIGGAVNLALNAKTDRIGGISVDTYAVFIAFQCLSPLIAVLISNPKQVQRTDGVVPAMPKNEKGFWREVGDTYKLWAKPRHWLFAIPFFMTEWGRGTVSFYLATYFTVRARALTTLVGALLSQSLINIVGWYLDSNRFSVRFKAYTAAASLGALCTAVWTWFFVNQYRFHYADVRPVFDWDTPGFANAWIPVLMQNVLAQILYNWLYWVLGYLASGNEQTRLIANMRSIESVASALSYGLGGSTLPVVNLAAVNVAFSALSLFPLWKLVQSTAKREEELRVEGNVIGVDGQAWSGESGSELGGHSGLETPDEKEVEGTRNEETQRVERRNELV